MVELLERMAVMFQQEEHSYKTVDYLAPEYQNMLISRCDGNRTEMTNGASCTEASLSSTSTSGINDIWREKICEWSYQVIDHFDFSREVVSVSIHYLDRFLATRSCNKKEFQLSAMTTLFLAIKLYEPGKLSMHSMIELSRGYFQVEQMIAMEMAILSVLTAKYLMRYFCDWILFLNQALSWQVHPPTAYCFGKHMLYLLPSTAVSMDDRHAILELARFLTELSVIDYFFVIHKPSVVALASILNAMENISSAKHALSSFCSEIKKNTPLDPSHADVFDCCTRLRLLYAQGGYAHAATERTEFRTETVSPVCVTYSCPPAHIYHSKQSGF